jgi:hypothetical protein
MILTSAHRPPSGIAPTRFTPLMRLGAVAAVGDILQCDVARSSALATDSQIGSQNGSLGVLVWPDGTRGTPVGVVHAAGGVGERVRATVTGIVAAAVYGVVAAGDALVVATSGGAGFLRVPISADEGKPVRAIATQAGGSGGGITILPVLFDGDDPLGQVFFEAQSIVLSVILEQDHQYQRPEFGFYGPNTPFIVGPKAGGGSGPDRGNISGPQGYFPVDGVYDNQ